MGVSFGAGAWGIIVAMTVTIAFTLLVAFFFSQYLGALIFISFMLLTFLMIGAILAKRKRRNG